MSCRPIFHGNRLSMDCLTCGLGLATSACIDSHLHTLATIEKKYKTLRYEEETIIDLGENKSKIFIEYLGIVKQVEKIMLNQKIYGHKQDEYLQKRKNVLKDFYETLFQNPVHAVRTLKEYDEPFPDRSIFIQGHKTFKAWVNGIIDVVSKSRLYLLTKEKKDLRKSFLSILNLKSTPYSQSFIKTIPKNAELLDEYEIEFDVIVKIYKIPNQDSLLYVQENPLIIDLGDELTAMLKDAVITELKKSKENADFSTLYDSKMREFRSMFLNKALSENIPLEPKKALAMGREAAAWSVGIGAPLENLALDRLNITDIYIDAQNAAIYVEHQKYGLCHTLWQYNLQMLDRTFKNIVVTQKGTRKFTKDNPVIDVVLTRLAMRCHLQRPPATFGDLQAALRIMKDEPFTYPDYLRYNSFTPFFAGYDDVMVGLGCSEAVLGLKGVGKTAFTSAKIAAIGLKKRILPLQDIEEIPVKAYRKRGFHIGAVRVASSDRDDYNPGSSELDLISMSNASLRMGDACVIINEIRSRTAIQGVINMLNTQPGIFLLYNLHAQSLKDIQDRLELVFGMPAASMYSTDRYSFLKKIRYGRKSRMYRMLGEQFESDLEQRQFIPVFTLQRGSSIKDTYLKCEFCELPEASAKELYNVDLAQIAKKLKLKLIPPALKRRADETGLPPSDYVMEAFYIGKLYDLIYHAFLDYKNEALLEIDFVLKALNMANNIIKAHPTQTPNWGLFDKKLVKSFNQILQTQLKDYEETENSTGGRSKKSIPSLRPNNSDVLLPTDSSPDFSLNEHVLLEDGD